MRTLTDFSKDVTGSHGKHFASFFLFLTQILSLVLCAAHLHPAKDPSSPEAFIFFTYLQAVIILFSDHLAKIYITPHSFHLRT